MADGRPGRPKGLAKTGGRAKGTVNKAVTMASVKLRDTELTAEATVEAIRRGMTGDIGDIFETEPGFQLYSRDGPAVIDAATQKPLLVDGLPVLEWRQGDLMRRWEVGDIKPLHKLTEAQRWLVAGIEVVMKNAAAGDGKVDRVLKIKWADRTKYVELAAKYHALLTEKLDIGVTDLGAKLDAARLAAAARNKGRKVE